MLEVFYLKNDPILDISFSQSFWLITWSKEKFLSEIIFLFSFSMFKVWQSQVALFNFLVQVIKLGNQVPDT